MRAKRYLTGLLDQVERKNGWQLAEQAGEVGPQGVQRLLNAAEWDVDAVRDDLRRWLGAAGHPYVLAVSANHTIWRNGVPERVDALVAALPAVAWASVSAGEGSQGERLYDWACLRLPYPTGDGQAQWLLARRSLSDPTELAYYRAFGPAETGLAQLVRTAGMRWAIEEGFEDAKGVARLDQYEARQWTAWYRHITLALLAHAYLAVLRVQAQKQKQKQKQQKGGALTRLT